MRWTTTIAWVALALLCSTAGAHAQSGDEKVPVRITVTHLSDKDEGVDPKADPLIQNLGGAGIKVKSAKVIREETVKLAPGDVKSVKIGGGRKAHLQLMQADDDGALVAVDVEGGIKTDVKVHRGKRPLVIDAGRVGDGKRVLEIKAE